MRVDVTFVNFPVSKKIKAQVAEKIEAHASKYLHKISSARAIFSKTGHKHLVRLNISGGDWSISVNAESHDAHKSLEKAIDKLSSALRKKAERRKDKRNISENKIDMPISQIKRDKIKAQKKHNIINAFDKFEDEYSEYYEMMEHHKAS